MMTHRWTRHRPALGQWVCLLAFGFAILGKTPLSAQVAKTQLLSGVVIDAVTQRPLARATVRSDKYSRRTSTSGGFSFEIIRGEPLTVSSVGYQERRLEWQAFRKMDSVVVYMSPTSTQLSNVDQAAATEVIYKKGFENVLDYAFLGDTLAILAYMDYKPRTPASGEVYLRNTLTLLKYGKELARLTLPDGVRWLFHDTFGTLWVVGDGFYFEVTRDDDRVKLEPVEQKYFETYIAPASSTSPAGVFYTSFMPVVPQVNYFLRLKGKNEITPVRQIRNNEYFKQAPGDYQMLSSHQRTQAMELAKEHNLDAILFAPFIRANERDEQVAQPITQAFGLDDRLVIFDVLNSWIYHHDHLGNALDSVQMYHHRFDNERYRGMLQDRYTGKCYALHNKGGATYVRHISPLTGGAGRPMKLRSSFPGAVKVYNGWVFYTHRQPDSKEFRMLMREKLPW